jgi:hypothetical protein
MNAKGRAGRAIAIEGLFVERGDRGNCFLDHDGRGNYFLWRSG